MCDHDYYCANSLFCELNGGDCKHTVQAKHSRNKIVVSNIEKDDRFKPISTGRYYDDERVGVDICYIEKEITNEDAEVSG